MPEETASAPRRYTAFLSYRHADNRDERRRWAEWLHRELETYEVPRDLIGKKNERGEPIPASLYPVFRDEAELPADAELSAPIRRALENSATLIVLCSPRAVESRFVADEIRIFKELGKADRILAVILDGEPNADDPAKIVPGSDSARECFPEGLRFGVPRTDGTVDWTARAEPMAADVRPGGLPIQGYTDSAAYRAALEASGGHSHAECRRSAKEYAARLALARLKIVSGILGVPLGVLRDRDAEHRARRLRKLAMSFGVLALVALVASVFAAFQARSARARLKQAESARDAAEDLVTKAVFGLREKLVPLGKVAILEDMATAAENYYAKLPPELTSDITRRHEVWLLLNRAIIANVISDNTASEAAGRKALLLARELEARHPEDSRLRDDQFLALAGMAAAFVEEQRDDEADAVGRQLVELGSRWTKLEPDSAAPLRASLAGHGIRLILAHRRARPSLADLPIFVECQQLAERLKQLGGETPETRFADGFIIFARGMLMGKMKKQDEARKLFREAGELFSKQIDTDGEHPLVREFVLHARNYTIAAMHELAGQTHDEALSREAHRLRKGVVSDWEKLTALEPLRLVWWKSLAAAYFEGGLLVKEFDGPAAWLAWEEKGVAAADRASSLAFNQAHVNSLRVYLRLGLVEALEANRPAGWETRASDLIGETKSLVLAPANSIDRPQDLNLSSTLLQVWQGIVAKLDAPEREAESLREFRALATFAQRVIDVSPKAPKARQNAANFAGRTAEHLRAQHRDSAAAEFTQLRDRWNAEADKLPPETAAPDGAVPPADTPR